MATEAPHITLSEAFAERWRQKRARDTGQVTPFMEWALKVPEPKTGRLDFDRFAFQPELYGAEMANDGEAVIKKATQVGVSAWLLRWVLYHADIEALTGLYVFPKLKLMWDFGDARVKPVIQRSEYLRRRVPAHYVQNKGLRQIGVGWVYFRGSESKTGLDSVDADVLALDEYDTLRHENIPDVERRIGASLKGMIRRVGVPTIPGWGIDAAFEQTDKRRWLVKCERCREGSQPITYEENVDEEAHRIVCAKCRKPLDVRQGEWVPEHPDRGRRGYHIPRLIVPTANIGQIVEAHHKTSEIELETHFNKDLGEAWAPRTGRLSLDVLKAAARENLSPDASEVGTAPLRTMGVDVASVRELNVRVSAYDEIGDEHKAARKHTLFMGLAESFKQLEGLIRRFEPHIIVIDHLPETRSALATAGKFPGRVWLCEYEHDVRSQPFVMKEELWRVRVNRVVAIDAMMAMVREQRNLLPVFRPEGYDKHMQALVRVADKDIETGKTTVAYRSTGADDYAHAEVYDVVAHQVFVWQRAVSDAERTQLQKLDEMTEIERASLDAGTLDQNVQIDEYEPGFEE